MQITVRLFAFQAERVGTSSVVLDVPKPSSAADIVEYLCCRYPALPWPPSTLLARNQTFITPEDQLQPDDELAVIPPVSGG
jgi:molybdopterin converting factor small subunit